MKKVVFFLILGWLLINFRPAIAQTSTTTVQTDWTVTLPAGQTCIDLQVMNGNAYALIYLGEWNYFNHYRVDKYDANGNVIATVNKDDVKSDINMLCYDSKVLLISIIEDVNLNTGVKLYNESLSLLKDTIWSIPWINNSSLLQKLFFLNGRLWHITSEYDFNAQRRSIIKNLDPSTLSEIGCLNLDSVSCANLATGLDYNFFIEYGGSYYLSTVKQDWPKIAQRFKINCTPQIINSDPQTNGDMYINLFGYGESVYYLNFFSSPNSFKLIKKDTANFLTAWQMPLPYPGTSRNPNIFTLGNTILFAIGDGTVNKVNPADGSVTYTKTISNIPTTASKSHYFGKIKRGGNDYPFMIIGPTGSNPSELCKFYLLDPVTLDTIAVQTISGIGAGYKVKEAGNKVYLIDNKVIELSILIWPSLALVDASTGQIVPSGNFIIGLNAPAPDTLTFNANGTQLWIKNISGEDKIVKCKKIIIHEVTGSSNAFAWGGYFGPGIIESGNVLISVDSSFKGFRSYYYWGGHTGYTEICYIFYDAANPNDSIWYGVTYDIITGISETEPMALKVYPNPTSDFLCLSGSGQMVTEIFDLLGNLALVSPDKKINVSELRPGLYLARVSREGKIILSQKFIKN